MDRPPPSTARAKRVVIVGPAYPYRGGQALVESHVFETLTNLGYDCYTVSYRLLYPSILFPGTTQYDESGVHYNDHTERTFRIINSINPLSWFCAARTIKRLDPDAVLLVWWMPFFGPALSTIGRLVKRWTRARIVFLVDNYISHERRWFDAVSTSWTLRLGDHFIGQSEFITRRLSEVFPRTPVHRVTLPVFACFDLGAFDRASARARLGITTRNVVLFFGYIRPYKGLDQLIQAFPRVLEARPDTTLLIVGECYEDLQRYEDMIAAEGIAGKTIFVSKYVANEEIEPYFKASDMVCLPYRSATQSGIVMLAYGFRRPVVTTDVGGLPESVRAGKTGIVVPPGDVAALAGGVVEVLDLEGRVDFEANIDEFTHELGHRNMERIFAEITR
jgi:glycosyltransferase involved in cell wall biosynthesis